MRTINVTCCYKGSPTLTKPAKRSIHTWRKYGKEKMSIFGRTLFIFFHLENQENSLMISRRVIVERKRRRKYPPMRDEFYFWFYESSLCNGTAFLFKSFSFTCWYWSRLLVTINKYIFFLLSLTLLCNGGKNSKWKNIFMRVQNQWL